MASDTLLDLLAAAMVELDATRKRHRLIQPRKDIEGGFCDADDFTWPCDTRRVLDVLDRLSDAALKASDGE